MSRKILFSTIALLLLVVVGIFGYLYFSGNKAVVSIFKGGVFPSSSDIGSATPSGSLQAGSDTSTTTINSDPSIPQRIHQITADPISGSIVIESGSTTLVRYVDRATGHIYEAPIDIGAPTQISNTTIPKISEALWVPDGSAVYLRYLGVSGSLKTFYAKIKASSGTSTDMSPYTLEGNFLPDNITSLSLAPNGVKIFYLGSGGNSAIGVITNQDGSKKVQVFSSPLDNWQSMWSETGSLLLTSNAASSIPGISSLLSNVTSGKGLSQNKILTNIFGLSTSISPSGEYVIYSEIVNGTVVLKAISLKEKVPTARTLSLKTLPEKCVWSKKDKGTLFCAIPQNISGSNVPDSWYQGVVSFVDTFWKINITSGETNLIYSPQSSNYQYDAINLGLNTDESYLVFTNKKDNSLWSLQLSQQ